MKEITRINHVGLRVRDLEVTRLFYENLGFIFLVGPVGPEPVAIMEHPSGVNINFILNKLKNIRKDVITNVMSCMITEKFFINFNCLFNFSFTRKNKLFTTW